MEAPAAELSLEGLSDKSAEAVSVLVALLRDGFTGKIELQCSQGGVGQMLCTTDPRYKRKT